MNTDFLGHRGHRGHGEIINSQIGSMGRQVSLGDKLPILAGFLRQAQDKAGQTWLQHAKPRSRVKLRNLELTGS